MKICGIIAEYNPLHRGHTYHIRQARECCSHVIAVMSGNFTQRGEPALFDKRSRCQAALENGVDMVLELPVTYAVSGADRFAYGGVSILNSLGCVDMLSFGCEAANIAPLERMAEILVEEPSLYKQRLKANSHQGMSFAAARSKALASLGCPEENRPNAILAIEYLKHLKKSGSSIEPLPVLRLGSGYHDRDVQDGFSSALALRNLISSGGKLPPEEPSASIFAPPVFLKNVFPFVLYRLRTMSLEEIRSLAEVSEGLEYPLQEAAFTCCSLEALLGAVKTKRYALGRIKRILIHALLNMTDELNAQIDSLPLYARVLGVKRESLSLLSLLSKTSKIPLVVRPGELSHLGLDLDVRASDVYALLANAPGRQDYRSRFLIV